MAIVSYNEIIERIPIWAERNDLGPELIKDFVYLAEAECSQQLRVPAMENAVQLPVENGKITIPFDFMGLRRLTHEGPDKVLQYLSWDQFVEVNKNGGVGMAADGPTYYSRQGPNWFLAPTPADGDIILCHYYRFIPPLSDNLASNWLLNISPHAYLFGGLKYLYEFVQDQDRAAYWEAKFTKELNKLQALADREEHLGSVLRVREI